MRFSENGNREPFPCQLIKEDHTYDTIPLREDFDRAAITWNHHHSAVLSGQRIPFNAKYRRETLSVDLREHHLMEQLKELTKRYA